MTWDEFKAFVDAALREKGAGGDVRVWYIDVNHPDPDWPSHAPEFSLDLRLGLSVST